MIREKCLNFGTILKSHGIKGELLVKTHNPIPERMKLPEPVFLEIEGILVPFFWDHYKFTSDNSLLIKLEGIDNSNQCPELYDAAVWIEGKTTPAKKEKPADTGMIGYIVSDQNNIVIGKVTEEVDIPDNFLVEVDFAGKLILLPVNSATVIKLDKKNKTLRLNMPEGLTDL